MSKRLDLIWKTFWRITITHYVWKDIHRNTMWRWLCSCWREWIWGGYALKNWNTQSCWCLTKEVVSKRMKTHWATRSRFYRIWCNIKQRCNDKNNPAYKWYWWRWIKCEWNTFEQFREDMYESYLQHIKTHSENQTSIDRINNNWNYNIENCKRATRIDQQNNRRTNILLTYNWKTMSLMNRARYIWMKYSKFKARYDKWYSIDNLFYDWKFSSANNQWLIIKKIWL